MNIISVIKLKKNDQEYEIKFIQQGLNSLEKQKKFNGQKLLHPFQTKTIEESNTIYDKFKKKNIVKNTKTLIYSEDFLSQEIKNDIEEADRFELKHDGSCGMMFFDGEKFVPYARYDIKKDTNGLFGIPPLNSIACEEKPLDILTTHWPHFVQCNKDPKAYKWHLYAFDKMIKSGKVENLKTSFTCEYMGKKFNYKKSDPIEDEGIIVPHGLIILEIPKELRNYEGFFQIFLQIPYIEGLIIYGKNNLWKIRKNMFFFDGKRFEWPSKESKKLSEIVMLS